MMMNFNSYSRITDRQMECLCLLADGEWHDRQEIRQKLGLKFIPPNISSRIIKPLEQMGIIEQEKRPVKEGSKKIKLVARISRNSEWSNLTGDENQLRLNLCRELRNRCKECHAELERKQKGSPTADLDERLEFYQIASYIFDLQYKKLCEEYKNSIPSLVEGIPATSLPVAHIELMDVIKRIKPYIDRLISLGNKKEELHPSEFYRTREALLTCIAYESQDSKKREEILMTAPSKTKAADGQVTPSEKNVTPPDWTCITKDDSGHIQMSCPLSLIHKLNLGISQAKRPRSLSFQTSGS